MSHNPAFDSIKADELYPLEFVFNRCVSEWADTMDTDWPIANSELAKSFDAMWIDSRWQGDDDPDTDVAYEWIKSRADRRIKPTMGHSQNSIRKSRYREAKINPRTGAGGPTLLERGHYYHIDFVPEIRQHRVHIDADKWKIIVQTRVMTDPGKPGALLLYSSKNPREHATFVKHLDSEQLSRYFDSKKGNVEKFEQVREANHYLDATALACSAGHYIGYRVRPERKAKTKKVVRRSGIPGRNGMAFVATQR